jgi:membrane-bound lytic murein transglycosylase
MSRKIEALQEAAAQKAQEATERVEKALERMLKQNQKINFQTVSHSANVSTAYLYKYPELKNRIITLRDQQKNQSKPKQTPIASDNSKIVMINTLREETKRLRVEISELRRANEALTGRLYQVQSSNYLIERLKQENELLKIQLQEFTKQLESPKM